MYAWWKYRDVPMPAGMKGLKIWFSGDCDCVKAFSSTGEAWDQIDSDYSSLTL